MNVVRRYLARHLQSILIVCMLFILATILYLYGNKTFLPGFSVTEVQSINQSAQWSDIVKNPLWLPLKLAYLFMHAIQIQAEAFRYVSGLLAMLSVAAFYSIAKRWYAPRISALATILFGTSAITITLARVATPAILLYSWLWCIALVVWFRTTHKTRLAPVLLLFFSSFMLYSPGFAWFVVVLGAWFSKDIPQLFKHMKKSWIIAGGVISLLLAAPLVLAFINDPKLLRAWLLIPQTLDIRASILYLKDLPAAFFYQSDNIPGYNLGRLPLLDALSGTFLLIGLYAYRTKIKLNRTVIYIISFLLSWILAAINRNQIYLVFCLPFIYLLIGEGIGYLLTQWNSVFPRNPIARFVGTLFITIAVMVSSWYHIQRYFLAWINTPETKSIYSKRIN